MQQSDMGQEEEKEALEAATIYIAKVNRLVAAAIRIANVECSLDKDGCGGKWCTAQKEVRDALIEMGEMEDSDEWNI